jgi:ABC-type amino acid transport substrate-binding protein
MFPRNTGFILSLLLCVFAGTISVHAESPLLTPQENAWLRSRNNTIVVYPEKLNPPFSYQSASGILEGMSVDYIELVADKLGVTVQYLTPRSLSQILDDAAAGKGDVVITLTPTAEREKTFIFTEPYVTVPYVIVVRKDMPVRPNLSPADFIGKKLALINGSAVEMYMRQNFPRIVIVPVTDDEAALQQVVLGQADGAAMDVASLSFLLSKQVLSSVKSVGNIGYDFKPAFAMTKDKEILQSILEKGFAEITPAERKALAEKWVALPSEAKQPQGLIARLQSGNGILALYILVVIVLIGVLLALLRRRNMPRVQMAPRNTSEALHEELHELEAANQALQQEIDDVKHLEEDIEEKLKRLNE